MPIERHPDHPTRSFFWMVLSGLGFTAMSVFVKRLAPVIPQFELVFFRSLVNFIVQLTLVIVMREAIWPKKGKAILVFRGLAGFGGVSCLFYAIAHLPLSVAAMLNWCSPLFVILFSSMFLKERVPPRSPIWICLAFLGLVLLLRLDLTTGMLGLPLIPVLIGISGAAFGGLAYVAVRAATARVGVNVIILYFTGIATLLAAPLAFHQYRTLQPGELPQLIALGVFASVGQFAMTQAYRHAAAGLVSTMSLMNAAFMSLFGWIVFGELLTPGQWLGMLVLALAIGAIVLLNSQKSLPKSF
jgi:drug/metabolite transporter (DMT)-like permease